MKSILYIGALLMIGASIYGFVDYKKTSRRKEFRSLYNEKEVKNPAIPTNEKTNVVVNNEPVSVEKVIEVKDQPVKKSNNKKRKISYKLFSRAPLDRRYLDKELNSEELRRSEPVKIVVPESLEKNKEQ